MSSSPYLISFIVPFYNNEDYIVAALSSLLNQVTPDVEIVIIDDGSTDSSGTLVKEYLATLNLPQVTFISQKNGGVAHARNVGLAHVTGRYTAFLDGDDLLSPDFLNTLRPILIDEAYDIVEFNYQKFDQHPPLPSSQKQVKLVEYDFSKSGLDCLTPVFTKSLWHLPTRVYKHTLLAGESFPIGRRYEDVIFTPFIYFKSRKIAHLDQIFYFYRDNSQSITRNIKPKDIDDLLFAIDKMVSFAISHQNDQQIRNLAALMIINCLANVKSMTKALYGYYRYDGHTLKTFRSAAAICQGTSIPTKKVWQLRYPQVDTWLSKIRWQLKKR
ncbi:glycosyltransferase family 2 protein [Rouxiella sp. Mn2063]|uniref:glycosyltransferase family 2 protein n=1 Tax=Rouxiella sp. Mn2063 TaxID=3395262 RepID=UPI003BD95B9C